MRAAPVTQRFTAACIQLNTQGDEAENCRATSALIRQAVSDGAEFIATPETTNLMDLGRARMFELARPEAESSTLARLRDLAAELGVWLLIGSLVIRDDAERLSNRSFQIDPNGAVIARYDKIHMFDVAIPDGQTYRESAHYRPGEVAVLADLPWGRVGLTICYDVRFPALYRALAKAGAGILTVPSAFTRFTGEAHWHVLLRARAIETGCFVIAPAQCGSHARGRQTYGHSLIVAPWGEVLADGGEESGISLAEIDLQRVDQARGMVPALSHDRSFAPPAAGD